MTREGGVPTPRPPQTTTFPGAVAVEGPDARGSDDERRFSFTSSSDSNIMSNQQPTEVKTTVTAQLVVDNSEAHLESLEERIHRQEQQLEELRRNQQNVVVGQVLGAENNNFDDNGDEEEARRYFFPCLSLWFQEECDNCSRSSLGGRCYRCG